MTRWQSDRYNYWKNKKSIFVEIPDLKPVMQLYLRMKLKDTSGVNFAADLFASPMYPHPPYSAKGLAIPVSSKGDIGQLRTETTKPKKQTDWSGKITEGARDCGKNNQWIEIR